MDFCDLITRFSCNIGIVCQEVSDLEIPFGGFVDSAMIRSGKVLFCDRARPDEVLHELAHVAVFPREFRHLLSGDLSFSTLDLIQIKSKYPDFWSECNNIEAAIIGWEWFVCEELGIDPFDIHCIER